MTAYDMTERTQIEALAIQLGWAIQQAGTDTRFGYNDNTLTASWSPDGTANRAVVTNPGGQELARRETYTWQTRPVGAWVRMMLRAIVSSRPAGELSA